MSLNSTQYITHQSKHSNKTNRPSLNNEKKRRKNSPVSNIQSPYPLIMFKDEHLQEYKHTYKITISIHTSRTDIPGHTTPLNNM